MFKISVGRYLLVPCISHTETRCLAANNMTSLNPEEALVRTVRHESTEYWRVHWQGFAVHLIVYAPQRTQSPHITGGGPETAKRTHTDGEARRDGTGGAQQPG